MKPARLAEEIAKLERRARISTSVLGSEMSIKTTLVNELLAERAEMLSLLASIKRDVDEIGSIGMIGGTAYERLVEFLATRRRDDRLC
jgi:hypothetical protein